MVRALDFEYHLMRNGGDLGLVYPVEGSPPTVRMDDAGGIKTSFSGSFYPPEADVDWLTDEIRPEMIIDGVHHALGLFAPATVSRSDSDGVKTVRVEAYDRCWKVRDYLTPGWRYFGPNTKYLEAVGSLLAEAGISLISAGDSTATLVNSREWEIGTSYLDIVNELLAEINYKSLWFDGTGTARLEPWKTITADNIDHVLDDTNVQSMVLPALQQTTDIYSTPNVFVVVCSNAEKSAAMVAKAENANPRSPLSIGRRGRRIVQVTNVDNIASQAALETYAERLMTDSLIGGETVQVQTGLLPGFGVGDITALRYGNELSLCRETSWSMELTVGGAMTHTLKRQVIQLD